MSEVKVEKASRELDEKVCNYFEPKPPLHNVDFHLTADYSKGFWWYCLPEYDKGDVCEWQPIPVSSEIRSMWKVMEELFKTRAKVYFDYDSNDKLFTVHSTTDTGELECMPVVTNSLPVAVCNYARQVFGF